MILPELEKTRQAKTIGKALEAKVEFVIAASKPFSDWLQIRRLNRSGNSAMFPLCEIKVGDQGVEFGVQSRRPEMRALLALGDRCRLQPRIPRHLRPLHRGCQAARRRDNVLILGAHSPSRTGFSALAEPNPPMSAARASLTTCEAHLLTGNSPLFLISIHPCRPVLRHSANERTRIAWPQCGCAHFNNATHFVEEISLFGGKVIGSKNELGAHHRDRRHRDMTIGEFALQKLHEGGVKCNFRLRHLEPRQPQHAVGQKALDINLPGRLHRAPMPHPRVNRQIPRVRLEHALVAQRFKILPRQRQILHRRQRRFARSRKSPRSTGRPTAASSGRKSRHLYFPAP